MPIIKGDGVATDDLEVIFEKQLSHKITNMICI
jgi:hypothetical protein